MANPWKERILAYNRMLAEKKDKANDLDVLVQELLKLPPGQLKNVLTDEVVAVLEKYGYME